MKGLLIGAGQEGILIEQPDITKTPEIVHEDIVTIPTVKSFIGIDDNGDIKKTYEEPSDFEGSYMKALAEKRGIDYETLYNKFNNFAKYVGYAESRLNNGALPSKDSKSTARGFFQFNDGGIETVKNRLRNVSKRLNMELPEDIKSFIKGDKDITDLDYDNQKLVFKVNFAEHPNSNVADLMSDKNYYNQYLFHHADPKVYAHWKETGEIDYSLADDKLVRLNLDNVSHTNYLKIKPTY